jgi:hypothetical protein
MISKSVSSREAPRLSFSCTKYADQYAVVEAPAAGHSTLDPTAGPCLNGMNNASFDESPNLWWPSTTQQACLGGGIRGISSGINGAGGTDRMPIKCVMNPSMTLSEPYNFHTCLYHLCKN